MYEHRGMAFPQISAGYPAQAVQSSPGITGPGAAYSGSRAEMPGKDGPNMALELKTASFDGYDTGADDYITKPFSLMVLVSKVNALMRRLGSATETGKVLVSEDL